MPTSPAPGSKRKGRTVVIADDHELMREGIAAVMARQPGYTIAGCATDAASTFALLAQYQPDLLLIDIFLGGHDGTHLINELAGSYPATRILALCAFDDQTAAQRLFCAGASGFLTKSASSAQLVEAIEATVSGQGYSSRPPQPGRLETERTRVTDNGR